MPTINFQTCTGESRSYIAFRMQHRPCPALLHSTDPAQQELEATVFRALGEIRSPSAHPFHVKRIRLSKAHVPIVFLDGATGKVDVSATFLEVCLPGADGGSPAAGFGVRILHIHGRDLVLGLVETDARVIIRGSADTDWNALRSAHSRQVQGNGTPLWHEKRWTPAELALRDHPSSVSPEPRVRMESMLLRRIAIFTSFSSAHRTYAYAGGPDTTKMWLEYDPAVPKRHDELVSALTDPTWGLAMRVESDDCACACATDGMCVTVLTTAAGDATLRLQSVADRPVWGREYFEEIDAPRKWLNRAVPVGLTPHPPTD